MTQREVDRVHELMGRIIVACGEATKLSREQRAIDRPIGVIEENVRELGNLAVDHIRKKGTS